MNVLQINRSLGMGMKVLQTFQKFRVLWHGRTSSECGYKRPAELTEVPGTGKTRLNAHLLKGGVRFEVEDLIQLAWHVFAGPMSPRPCVVALR